MNKVKGTFPTYKWAEFDQKLYLTVLIPPIETTFEAIQLVAKPRGFVEDNRVFFQAFTRGKLYVFDVETYREVVPNESVTFDITNEGYRIVIEKKDKEIAWPRFTKGPKTPFEKTDWDLFEGSDDEELPKDKSLPWDVQQNPQTPPPPSPVPRLERLKTLLLSFPWLDLLVFCAVAYHCLMAPYTKVEESFNTQAVYDILYHQADFEEYDHHQFPGVVPRTFIGAIVLAVLTAPFALLARCFDLHPTVVLVAARLTLGCLFALAFRVFRRAIEFRYGRLAAKLLVLVTLVQFHLAFYMTRPLPNTFAVIIVLVGLSLWVRDRYLPSLLTVVLAGVLFRSELALLFGPMALYALMHTPAASSSTRPPSQSLPSLFDSLYPPQHQAATAPPAGSTSAPPPSVTKARLTFFGRLFAASVGVAVLAAGVSVAVDSFLWGRLLYPEGEVLYYNTVLNKSGNWGTEPFYWYFVSALPKALPAVFFLLPWAFVVEPDTSCLTVPSLTFVALYSFLPHKELRFVFYVLPLLSAAGAVTVSRLYTLLAKPRLPAGVRGVCRLGLVLFVLSLAASVALCGVSVAASASNYPGAAAVRALNGHLAQNNVLHARIHIDTLAATTGVSLFTCPPCSHFFADSAASCLWSYDKTENLQDFRGYTHLISEHPTVDGFDRIGTVEGYAGLSSPTLSRIPFSLFPSPTTVTVLYLHAKSTPPPA